MEFEGPADSKELTILLVSTDGKVQHVSLARVTEEMLEEASSFIVKELMRANHFSRRANDPFSELVFVPYQIFPETIALN